MTATHHQHSAQSARLQALRARHAALARQIEEEQRRPSASPLELRALKTRKLRLKEEIEAEGERA